MVEQDIQIVQKIKDKNLVDNMLFTFMDISNNDEESLYYTLEIFIPANNHNFIALAPRLIRLFSKILDHKYPENYIDVTRDFMFKDSETKLKGPNYIFFQLGSQIVSHLKNFLEKYNSENMVVHESVSYRRRADDVKATTVRRYNHSKINIRQLYIDLYQTYIDEISTIEKFDDLVI